MSKKARFFVVSGPSGAGKGTLVGRLINECPDLHLAVSATTRSPRPLEVDGISYHFMSEEAFRSAIEAHAFVEWAQVHGNLYGTLRREVESHLAEGTSVLLEIDVQGALQVKKDYPDAVLIFIEPPSIEELRQRLLKRGTEDEASIELRLAGAKDELAQASKYDLRIINDDLEEALVSLKEHIHSYEMTS